MSQRHQSHAKAPESSCYVPIACSKFPYQNDGANEDRRSDDFKLNSRAAETILDDQTVHTRRQTIWVLSARQQTSVDNAFGC